MNAQQRLSRRLATGLQVPQDAHTVDIVLSDSGDDAAGFFDNNDGLDYHIPVTSSSRPAHPLHVVHIAVEMAPVAKVLCLVPCLCLCRSMIFIAVGMDRVTQELWLSNIFSVLPAFFPELFSCEGIRC